jgi:CHASE3 domain sensor protein
MAADSTIPARLHRTRRHHRLLPPTAVAGIVVALVAIVLIAWFSWLAMENRQRNVESMQLSAQTVSELRGVLSDLQNAETGQRGYLLVGTEIYLTPYNQAKGAIGPKLLRLRALMDKDAPRLQRLGELETLASEKMQELEQAVGLYRSGNQAAALALVQTNRGRVVMDNIRDHVDAMLRAEQARQEMQQGRWQSAVALSTVVQVGGASLLLLLLAVAALMISRDYVARETQIWLRAGQAGLGEKMQGEQRLEVLGDSALAFLAQYLEAQVGALYLAEAGGGFRRVAGFGVPADAPLLQPGEGLLGQAAKSRAPLVVHDLPDGYLPLNSALGRGRPQAVLAAPAVVDGQVLAVVELGFTRRLDAADMALMAELSHQLGVAVRSARDRSQLESLLEETQRQAEELQVQQEELRTANEELEEQSARAEPVAGCSWKASRPSWSRRMCSCRRAEAHVPASATHWTPRGATCRSAHASWSAPASTSRSSWPTCRTSCARR